MKALYPLILFALGSSALAAPPSLKDGLEIIERLNSPRYLERELATKDLERFSRQVFDHVSLGFKEGKEPAEGWNNLRNAIIQSGEASTLKALRDKAYSMGAESIQRFNHAQLGWQESARKAALAARLDAPSDFEAKLMAQKAPTQIQHIPIPGAF